MMEKPFDIFISHSSKNKEIAERFYWLALTNQQTVWYDSQFLDAGLKLRDQLKNGIEQSRLYLLFLTKDALQSEFVKYEMEIARQRVEEYGDLQPLVVKLSEGIELDVWWDEYFYTEWSNDPNEAAQLVPLLSRLTGRDPVGWITEASFLAPNPSEVFVNESRTIVEHARNATLYYLSAIKSIMLNPGNSAEEQIQTLNGLSQLALLDELPIISGGWIPIRPGEIELIHPVRMRRVPKIELIGLPEKYTFDATGTQIATHIKIIDKQTRELVKHPVPFSIALDAEM